MVEVLPFRGILYNHKKVDIRDVVTPPYDIISGDEQERYYERSPYNIIRLILGKEYPDDDFRNNKYTRAAGYLKKWLSEKILLQDKRPSIYIYQQRYFHRGREKERTGFISLLKIEEGKIFSHEGTLPKPVFDRLELLRACRANLSPVFMLYSDPARELDGLKRGKPMLGFKDDNGISHKLWRVSSKKVIERVREVLSGKNIYIADGHHRYEAALLYRKEVKYRGANYLLVYLANMNDVTILPAHRGIKGIKLSRKKLSRLRSHFHLEECGKNVLDAMEEKRGDHAFGIFDGKRYYLLILKERSDELDVKILHKLMIDEIITEGKGIKVENIIYFMDESDAVEWVKENKNSFVIFVNPTEVSQVREAAESGKVLPGKATYFYPKLLTGLVLRVL